MRILPIIILLASLFGQGAVQAAEGPWLDRDIVKMRLISAVEAHEAQDSLLLGLEVKLKDDWKTYWRTPGDAGLAPQIFLDPLAMAGAKASISFPVPKRFSLFDLDTFGYGRAVIFPIDLKLGSPLQAYDIKMMIDMLVCDDICVPVQGPLSLSLAKGLPRPSIYHQELAKIAALIPKSRDAALRVALSSSDKAEGSARDLIVHLQTPMTVHDMLVEGPAGLSFAVPEQIETDRYLIRQIAGNHSLSVGDEVTITVDAGEASFEATSKIVPSLGEGTHTALPFWLMALIGGFILNFMPCVLPVLSLKVSHVMAMAGARKGLIRARFLSSAAGIVTSFILLAFFLQMVRLAGGQVGWGIQFQNPYFLGMLSLVTGLFALSLFDVITWRTPAFVGRLLPRQQLASELKDRHILSHDFAAGMLATLLATPCSAPFVGTAVSFALSQSDMVLYGMLLMMGLGLALPWLVLGAMPQLVTLLPKPGQWMVRLKQFLGVLMVLTTIWVASLFVNAAGYRTASDEASLYDWQPFDTKQLAEWREAGDVIFVDVTADWCVTCKANKALVLETKEVASLFKQANVKFMQADWTLPDDEIAQYLLTYQRYGIPFNILYGPGRAQEVILPEILTVSALKKALAQANQ